MIRHIEFSVIEKGFSEGWIQPLPAKRKSGKRIAVVGSGPAGLVAAQQLARTGHAVVVFEKDSFAGGLLRYGIPSFKLEKGILERRLEQLRAEGVEFQTGVNVGEDISARYLRKMFDCVMLAAGAGQPRDIPAAGRGYENIVFAMDFLSGQARLDAGEALKGRRISASGRKVVVIGGGDTGSDCVGTARRQGAQSIVQLEILPEPPATRPPETPWPEWPKIMRTSSSHEEGCERLYSIMTNRFSGMETRVSKVHCRRVEWFKKGDEWKLKELDGTDFVLDADLVLLAMGFLHVAHEGLVKKLGLDLDRAGNIAVKNFQTSEPWVFSAGDSVTGASLVVRAIAGGRAAAAAINSWLKCGR